MRAYKITFSVRLSEAQREKLDKYSKEIKKKPSEVVRGLIDKL